MGVTAINGVDITASLANSSSKIQIFNDDTTAANLYVPFVKQLTQTGFVSLGTDSLFYYNPIANTLTANTFAGTASAASRVDVGQGAGNAANYIIFTPQFNAGGTNPAAVTQSSNLQFNPATYELKAGTFSNTANGTKTYTVDGNLTIDASLTQSMTWIASFTTTRSLIINNLTDGRTVNVYIRNTNATQRQIIFSGSTTTSGHSAINMAVGAGAASVTTQNIAATNGTMMADIRTIGSNIIGGLM